MVTAESKILLFRGVEVVTAESKILLFRGVEMVTAESKIFSVAVQPGKSQETHNYVYKVNCLF